MTDPLLTLPEAATRLDPPISPRTLRDLVTLAAVPHQAVTRHGRRGRPAKLYRAADLDRLHAAWVRREFDRRIA